MARPLPSRVSDSAGLGGTNNLHFSVDIAVAWTATAREKRPKSGNGQAPLEGGEFARPEISALAFSQRLFQILGRCTR